MCYEIDEPPSSRFINAYVITVDCVGSFEKTTIDDRPDRGIRYPATVESRVRPITPESRLGTTSR